MDIFLFADHSIVKYLLIHSKMYQTYVDSCLKTSWNFHSDCVIIAIDTSPRRDDFGLMHAPRNIVFSMPSQELLLGHIRRLDAHTSMTQRFLESQDRDLS